MKNLKGYNDFINEGINSSEIKLDMEDYWFFGHNAHTINNLDTGELGEEIRNKMKIDQLSEIYDKITINFPSHLNYSLSNDFLVELFKNVVHELGKEGFNEKFIFTYGGYGKEWLYRRINIAIDIILNGEEDETSN